MIKRASLLCKAFGKKDFVCNWGIGTSPRFSRPIKYVFFEPKVIKGILQVCFRGLSGVCFRAFFPRRDEVWPCWHRPTLSSSLPRGPTSFSDLYRLRARRWRSSFGITNHSGKNKKQKSIEHLLKRSDLTFCLQPHAETFFSCFTDAQKYLWFPGVFTVLVVQRTTQREASKQTGLIIELVFSGKCLVTSSIKNNKEVTSHHLLR